MVRYRVLFSLGCFFLTSFDRAPSASHFPFLADLCSLERSLVRVGGGVFAALCSGKLELLEDLEEEIDTRRVSRDGRRE